jgi:hypothetical protein
MCWICQTRNAKRGVSEIKGFVPPATSNRRCIKPTTPWLAFACQLSSFVLILTSIAIHYKLPFIRRALSETSRVFNVSNLKGGIDNRRKIKEISLLLIRQFLGLICSISGNHDIVIPCGRPESVSRSTILVSRGINLGLKSQLSVRNRQNAGNSTAIVSGNYSHRPNVANLGERIWKHKATRARGFCSDWTSLLLMPLCPWIEVTKRGVVSTKYGTVLRCAGLDIAKWYRGERTWTNGQKLESEGGSCCLCQNPKM